MDSINRWVAAASDNPLVQLLAFACMLVIRMEVDAWARRRAERKARKAKKPASA